MSLGWISKTSFFPSRILQNTNVNLTSLLSLGEVHLFLPFVELTLANIVNSSSFYIMFSSKIIIAVRSVLVLVYVDMGLAYNSPVTLTIVTSGSGSSARSFSIKVTQIDCTMIQRGTFQNSSVKTSI